MQEVKKQGCH